MQPSEWAVRIQLFLVQLHRLRDDRSAVIQDFSRKRCYTHLEQVIRGRPGDLFPGPVIHQRITDLDLGPFAFARECAIHFKRISARLRSLHARGEVAPMTRITRQMKSQQLGEVIFLDDLHIAEPLFTTADDGPRTAQNSIDRAIQFRGLPSVVNGRLPLSRTKNVDERLTS